MAYFVLSNPIPKRHELFLKKLSASEAVVRETDALLQTLRVRYPNQPRKQMVALHLLGLEREQIVAVSYREDTLRERMEGLLVNEEERKLVRYAMRWIWKEEQMHTIFIRGALLRSGGLRLKITAFVQQLSGAIGGWATAVLHHVSWRKAPLSRFWAHVFTLFGLLMGKLPRAMLKQMREVSFRDYCRFSFTAEHTAAMCWRRVGELAEEVGEAAEVIASYRQMATDEGNHGSIFALFLEAFGEDDSMAAGWNAARLAKGLAAIGEFYLPPALRPTKPTVALGRGGKVAVARGGAEESKEMVLNTALSDAGFSDVLAAIARDLGKPIGALTVAIKPCFMRGYHLRDPSPHTDPELVRALACRLRDLGCEDITLLENACIYDWYFANRDVHSVASYLGFDFPEARLVDVATDMVPHRYRRGMAHYQVAASWRDADVRIAFGKLSSHPVDQVYLSLGQLEGLSARPSEFIFVDRQAHRGQATMAMIAEFPPHFSLLDGYAAVADGLLGVIACPQPLNPKRIYAGADVLAVDLVAARHVGEQVHHSSHMDDATFWFDNPTEHIEVVGCDAPIRDWKSPCHNEVSSVLSLMSYPVYLMLSGRGSLFVPEMDEQAFPPLGRPSWPLRRLRHFMRWLLRTRLPAAE